VVLNTLAPEIELSVSIAVAVMLLLWLAGVARRNFSYVDIGWSLNFALIAFACAAVGDGWAVRRVVFTSMVALWSLRLALHLAGRIIGQPEEGRYIKLRESWGRKSSGSHASLNLKFFGFFQFQALLNILLCVPVYLVSANTEPQLQTLELVGIALWVIALAGESIADVQLAAFKQIAANRGEVCDRGLWKYSRHPNYFFESLIWCAYAVFALPSPHGWMALSAPLLMLFFLLKVTGIKATEEQSLRSKGEKYRRYQQRTSAFIPLPPRQSL
jgi:steroid 5-alpha reductase family enzyme